MLQRRWKLIWMLAVLLAAATQAQAQSQSCAGVPISEDAVRCPDGSIPSYELDAAVDPAVAAAAARKAAASAAYANTVFGIWHTNRAGLSYKSVIDVPGYTMLNISPGLAPGDLTIDPNGSYVWNTTTAMSGHWIKGKSSPVALVDSNQHKNWNVRIVDGHIEINDGQSLTRYVGQR